MTQYKRWIGLGVIVLLVLVLLAGFALAGSPFDPQPGFGCVPTMRATMVNDQGTPVPGMQTWTLINEEQTKNSADEWRLKCKYAFSAILPRTRD